MKAALTKVFVMSALVLSGANSMHAEEASYDEATPVVNENVIVNSCPLSPEKKALMDKMRNEEMEQERQALEEETESLELSGTLIPIKSQNLLCLIENRMNVTAATNSPYVYHRIEKFPQENVVELEDCSQWIFDRGDIATVRLWRPGHSIILTPKGASLWGSNYNFVMTNEDKNVSVPVNPCRGCKEFYKHSTWVAGMDRNMCHIIVVNGEGETTKWEIASPDRVLFEEWLVNQHIIMGPNDSWFWKFSAYDHIIYNYHMNHYVHARQIN